jgi:hypothetical protein
MEKDKKDYEKNRTLVRVDNFGLLLVKIDKIIEEMQNIKKSMYFMEDRQKLILKHYGINNDSATEVIKKLNDEYIPSKNELKEFEESVSKSEL